MISFYPKVTETHLIEASQNLLHKNFQTYIKPIKEKGNDNDSKTFLFNGAWNNEGFSISLKLKIANNFIPLIQGKYLESDQGILMSLTYEMFPATKKLLAFWTIITLLITIFFVVFYQAWIYGAISLGFCIVNYVLSRENFKIQVRKSKRMLEKVLS